MKEKENLGVGINVLDRGDTESTKEDYKEEVVRLKKDEIEKWSRMIEMIKATMRGSTDPQMEILLNQIIQQSEENKKWLEDHLQKNSETIETRLTTR
jgi:Trp operon repressor